MCQKWDRIETCPIVSIQAVIYEYSSWFSEGGLALHLGMNM